MNRILIRRILIRLALFALRTYQLGVSPLLPSTCRYYPTCSDYARQALVVHGLGPGLRLALQRVLRCHPGHPGGYDPVPKDE